MILNPYVLGVFRPSDLAGLTLWLKADAITSLVDGDPIGTWADASGNAKDATGTTTQRPTYKTSILNGLPVARFNGTANGLATPSIDLTGTSAVTVFVVAKCTNTGSIQMPIECSTNHNSFTTGFALYRDSVTDRLVVSTKGDVGYSYFNGLRAFYNRAEVISTTIDKSIGVSPPNTGAFAYIESLGFIGGLQMNGSNGAGGGVAESDNTNAFGNNAMFVGARNKTSLFFTGDIAEVIVYNRALTDAQRGSVDRYLIAKWGLQHPAGTLVCVGDSLTAGTDTTSPYPGQLNALLVADGYDFNWGNFGMSGWITSSMSTYQVPRVAPYVGIDGGKSVAVVWGGTNDMAGSVGNLSAAAAYASYAALCSAVRASGYKVIAMTALPRSDAAAGGSFNARRAAFNPLVVANYTTFADALYNCAADSRIGDDGDELDTTYYASTAGAKVHLNNTGQGIIAAGLKPLVEAF